MAKTKARKPPQRPASPKKDGAGDAVKGVTLETVPEVPDAVVVADTRIKNAVGRSPSKAPRRTDCRGLSPSKAEARPPSRAESRPPSRAESRPPSRAEARPPSREGRTPSKAVRQTSDLDDDLIPSPQPAQVQGARPDEDTTDAEASQPSQAETEDKSKKRGRPRKEPREFPCPDCDRVFFQWSQLLNHEGVHEDPLPFLCMECPKGYPTEYRLKKHEKRHFKHLRRYRCTDCPAKFWEKAYLKNHIRDLHSGVQNYSCSVCDQKFHFAIQAYVHKLKMHPLPPNRTEAPTVSGPGPRLGRPPKNP